MTTLSQILQHKLIAIIRGAQPADVLSIVDALLSGGIKAVEITLNSNDALAVIKNIAENFKDKILVGAGTVLGSHSARVAIKAGAQFIIAPSVDIETISVTKQLGIVSIPGAFTATEIVTAFKAGGDIIKLFPASNVQYMKDLRGPLSHIPLMPTGGVSIDNIKDFQKAGAVAFGIGSALVDGKQAVTKEYLQQLSDKAAKFVEAVSNT
jgi:2-dehydro-3-deoxyphosphogluconate aldolase/(4S)-4-hydroxy-2-oxoglutarate aldolase